MVGDSNVVGMPMSWLMRDAGAASTTLLHTQAVDFLKAYRDMDPRERRSAETRRAPRPKMKKFAKAAAFAKGLKKAASKV